MADDYEDGASDYIAFCARYKWYNLLTYPRAEVWYQNWGHLTSQIL